MGALNALDRLQAFSKAQPALGLNRAVSILRAGPVSASGFDYAQAMAIIEKCPEVLEVAEGTRTMRLRIFIYTLILQIAPSWKWLIPLGRSYLANHLSPDGKQVFEAAGLYGSSDDPEVREWWDRLAQLIRGISAQSNLDLGRRGEYLTIAHERDTLSRAGRSDLEPSAVGFEDNTLGYDVQSFSVQGATVRPKYVEVKTTERDAMHFYLSRNEWRAAERYGDDFFIHLWHAPTERLFEINFEQLSGHIPGDQGSGLWETVIIAWR
ncbi:hypothetical protein BH10ACI4_BH10ACI4_38820 [soil metagenome]